MIRIRMLFFGVFVVFAALPRLHSQEVTASTALPNAPSTVWFQDHTSSTAPPVAASGFKPLWLRDDFFKILPVGKQQPVFIVKFALQFMDADGNPYISFRKHHVLISPNLISGFPLRRSTRRARTSGVHSAARMHH